MGSRDILVKMIEQLLDDMRAIQQQGAGYYTCVPFAKRYNKLLHEAVKLYGAQVPLLQSFENALEEDPKDPNAKHNILQGIRVEIGQLLAVLGAVEETAP